MVEPVHVSHADAPPARRRRRWRVAGIVLAGLVLVVAACEVAGWPFLVGPAERMLSRVLDREVLLSSEVAGDAQVRFFGGVKATAPVLIEQGMGGLDFLRGDEPYKYDLGAQDQEIYRMRLRRNS